MIDYDIFKDLDPEKHCVSFAYAVGNLAKVGRLALENDDGGIGSEHKEAAVASLFEVIEAMMCVVIDGSEDFERQLKKGPWAPEKPAAA
ncbi:hypothetical protein [Paenirhodobacter populi]|uniref:DUF3077 domain-containing protein n=1 Tax=Paenirhodobacter populi TaxID=2306993 RepID=A0A443IQF1_9RHOB|nr:hypothetical protein [Sinirhodobacter populi]RWR08495.1 hypothetical protein D2T33_15480 [Sinirhodobacter populi]